MTSEEVLLNLERSSGIDFEPNKSENYEKILNSILKESRLDLINSPTEEKMKGFLNGNRRSLDIMEELYLLPFLLMDFHRKDPNFLYDKNRLSNYLECFWTVLDEMNCSRAFNTFIIDKMVRLLKQTEGFKSDILSNIILSIEKLNTEFESVQIAYISMLVEKIIRIQSIEIFHALDLEGYISDFNFEEINFMPLSRLIDCHFHKTEKGKRIYKCLKREEKVFAYNFEFRRMSKDILVDKRRWSIRNKHIHASLDLNNEDTVSENRIIRMYLAYFIIKYNTTLLNMNWEYLEDNWEEVKPTTIEE